MTSKVFSAPSLILAFLRFRSSIGSMPSETLSRARSRSWRACDKLTSGNAPMGSFFSFPPKRYLKYQSLEPFGFTSSNRPRESYFLYDLSAARKPLISCTLRLIWGPHFSASWGLLSWSPQPRPPDTLERSGTKQDLAFCARGQEWQNSDISAMFWNILMRTNGAQKRTRTSTPFRAPPPEDGASTNSAIWAQGCEFAHPAR